MSAILFVQRHWTHFASCIRVFILFLFLKIISSFIPNNAWSAQQCTFYKLRSILRFVIYYKHRRHQLFFFCSILISCHVVLFFVSLKSHINWKIQPFYCLNKRFLLLLSLCLIKQTDHFNINAKLVHFIHASVLHGFLVYLMWFFFFLL